MGMTEDMVKSIESRRKLVNVVADYIMANGRDSAVDALSSLIGINRRISEILIDKFIEQYMADGAVPAPDTPPEDPKPAPPPSSDWQERIGRQFFLMAAPSYFWPFIDVDIVDRALDAVVDAGLDGVDIELNGPFPVYEYNGERIRNLDVEDTYRGNIAVFRDVWLPRIRQRGLIASVKFLNSNQSDANRWPDDYWQWVATYFVEQCGSANIIVMPMNENDQRTRQSIERAIRAGLLGRGFPPEQLIGYGGGDPGYFNETHPQKGTDISRGDYRILNVADSGGSIRYLYGDDWRDGGSPNLGNIRRFAESVKRAGTSGAIYSFGRSFDFAGCKAAGEGWS